MSLRTRLALSFALVALVATALVGGFSFRTTTNELEASIDRFLLERIDDTAEALTEQRGSGGRLGEGVGRGDGRPGRIFDGRPVADDDAIIQIRGARGVVVSSGAELPESDEQSGGGQRTRFDDIELSSEPYRMASRATPAGSVIQVARSTEEIETVRRALIGRFALISTLVALAAAGLGALIATRTTAPLRRLTAVASGVAADGHAATDLGVEDDDASRDDEIGQLAAGFRSMLQRLDASRAQQHRLIHDAGHELRTPLTSLRMNVEMLERAGDLPDDQRAEILLAIRSELLELSDLFEEMVDLATDQRDVDFRPVPVDLDTVVRSVATKWERRSDRPITVESASAIVSGDAAMLGRAVENLISNADKFSPAGTVVDIVAADGVVNVRDRGPGIPETERALVFDRFHRSETTRSMPGSGLGLSIVKQIVDVHGGDVHVSESPAGGADVGFRIPTAPE